MSITNKKSPLTFTYRIDNTPLDWVSSFKYLGVLVDNKLKWTEHTNQVSSKATKILNLLRRNLHHSSRAAKTRTYMALVRPILEYAAPVWSPHQKLQTTKLENIQKRATRWITAKWDKNTYTWDKAYTECMQELN